MKRWSEDETNQMLDLVSRGWLQKDIAKKIGRTHMQVMAKIAHIRNASRAKKKFDPDAYSPTKPITAIVPQSQIARMYAGRKYQDMGL